MAIWWKKGKTTYQSQPLQEPHLQYAKQPTPTEKQYRTMSSGVQPDFLTALNYLNNFNLIKTKARRDKETHLARRKEEWSICEHNFIGFCCCCFEQTLQSKMLCQYEKMKLQEGQLSKKKNEETCNYEERPPPVFGFHHL